MSRGAMTHRAVITRSTSATTDAWNRPSPPIFTALKTIACRAWVKTKKEVHDDGKEVVISDHRAIFPRDADIQTGDRVSITDRRGSTIFVVGNTSDYFQAAEPLPSEIHEVHAM